MEKEQVEKLLWIDSTEGEANREEVEKLGEATTSMILKDSFTIKT